MRLLSGEKTTLCKNICCRNGCQTPFCGRRLFFVQRLSFVLIIYVGERIMIKNMEYGAMQSTVDLFFYVITFLWKGILSGFSMHIEACHVTMLFNVGVNYKAPLYMTVI